MAAPHVAGAAAKILQLNPGYTPFQVRANMFINSTPGKVINAGAGTPNRLLYSR
jgi:subtilisin family serine protease